MPVVFTLVLIALFYTAKGTISWIANPSDVFVPIGQTAEFPCHLSGADTPAPWIINGSHALHQNELPPRHNYFGWVLHITNVNIMDNMTRYQCGEALQNKFFLSSVGILYVLKQDERYDSTEFKVNDAYDVATCSTKDPTYAEVQM